ncbi:MAG TPA: DUF1957 domain-containing protein [Kiritimatiellia bacterium]|nr:DUF1957 domain-containing protein [Kiritimatiellia bacterium]HMP96159.1 DUF1957 domain-containing protein [Kiritimatiellia bacterium]
MKTAAYLSIVLHAHLPYVRHPEHTDSIEERWLFEAVRESYLPLLRMLSARRAPEHTGRIALSISPTLIAMLDDPLLRGRCARHLERVALLADRLVKQTAGDARWHPLARFYQNLSETNLVTWRSYDNGNLVDAWIDAERRGVIELLTTTATHAFLPIWKRHPETIRRQVEVGVAVFQRRMGREPAGLWLPECGYYPGLESFLGDCGIRYFLLEAHGLLHAHPRPPRGVFAPVVCPNGVTAFGRDPESSKQVWSAQVGYPGDVDYREYYRDIGSTLPRESLVEIFPDADIQPSTGFKMHRITGVTEDKEPYHPGRASEKARQHAVDFLHKKHEQARRVDDGGDVPPMFLAPYDAELFGHWWFEGPLFLEALLKLTDAGGPIAMITPSDYLARHPGGVEAVPSASTWGAKGYHDVWLNDTTSWMYPHLFRAAERAIQLEAEASPKLPAPIRDRLIAQAHSELMLAQSSDWPFMLNTGSHVEYAEKRIRDHLARFYWLADALARGEVDERKLSALETVDRLFTV